MEIFDVRKRKTFLKRCVPHETVAVHQLVVGSTVTIMSRPLKVVEYLNDSTAAHFAVKSDSSCMLILPDAYARIGSVLSFVSDAGLDIVRCRMLRFSAEEARQFLALSDRASSAGGDQIRRRAEFLESDAIVAVELSGCDIVSSLHLAAGPADPKDAQEVSPSSIRAVFGTSTLHNCVHVSSSISSARAELEFLFSPDRQPTHVNDNCSVLVVKPHAVLEKQAGLVIQHLLDAGVEIAGMTTLSLSRHDASDFLSAYKGVVPEHPMWVSQLSSGKCVALQCRGDDIVRTVRELAGPYDPEIARHLRPGSLRAKFGSTSVTNCVHVTDLPHDGPLESQFLFEVLQ